MAFILVVSVHILLHGGGGILLEDSGASPGQNICPGGQNISPGEILSVPKSISQLGISCAHTLLRPKCYQCHHEKLAEECNQASIYINQISVQL